MLKPLAAALADGDRVYAVVRGSGVNQDGRTTGMTVPSAAAQEALLREALAAAGRRRPAELQYVEAHGTGTPVGDPIEAAALGAVLADGARRSRCAIGSVKTNIGHLEAAAGIAGLIKTALALHHGELPAEPPLHRAEPGDRLRGEPAPRRHRARAVAERPRTRLAGVNSFGFGGANANVVLREAPNGSRGAGAGADDRRAAAHALGAQPRGARGLRARLALVPRARRALSRRRSAAAAAPPPRAPRPPPRRRRRDDARSSSTGSTPSSQTSGAPTSPPAAAPAPAPPKLVFVFSGMGPQWWGMGRELLEHEPVFREALERCDAALRGLVDWSLARGAGRDEASSRVDESRARPGDELRRPGRARRALASSGAIVPDAVVGHSAGEIAAAYVSGALDARGRRAL